MKTQHLIAGLLSLSATTALAAPTELPRDCVDEITAPAVRVANSYFNVTNITEAHVIVKNAKVIRSSENHHGGYNTTYRADFSGSSEKGGEFSGKVIVEMTRGGCMLESFQFTVK